ncbi:MAG TPA: tetratricopeptide repeat protein [Bryobacteraceae bacterium]|nr:tetratricopeptide repeat protein [Bryobacteraceae bacterium]
MPQTPWTLRPGWNSPTPAQQDWFDAMLAATAPLPKSEAAAASEASVSLARLRHNPPRKAVRLFLEGVKLGRAGKWPGAAADFERATALDPQFSEAYGNLGTSLAAMGQFEQAISDFRHAIELDPATAAHHLNLAYSLMRLNRGTDAGPEARAAVALDPTNAKAHYLLGVLFAQRAESRNFAIQHLAYAGRELPEAHYVLAQIYSSEGDARAASREIEQYRKQPEYREKKAR